MKPRPSSHNLWLYRPYRLSYPAIIHRLRTEYLSAFYERTIYLILCYFEQPCAFKSYKVNGRSSFVGHIPNSRPQPTHFKLSCIRGLACLSAAVCTQSASCSILLSVSLKILKHPASDGKLSKFYEGRGASRGKLNEIRRNVN